MKARHPEAILLSRVGDFYEAYGGDAETIARALQIALTSKEAGGGQRVAMAGVPHHALYGYLAKLVAAAIHRRARRAARGAATEPAGSPRRRASGDARHADRRAPARRQAEQLSRGGRDCGRNLCDRIRRRFDRRIRRRPRSRARTRTTNCSPSWRASPRRRSSPTFPARCAPRSRLRWRAPGRGWRQPGSASSRRASVRVSRAFRWKSRLPSIVRSTGFEPSSSARASATANAASASRSSTGDRSFSSSIPPRASISS